MGWKTKKARLGSDGLVKVGNTFSFSPQSHGDTEF